MKTKTIVTKQQVKSNINENFRVLKKSDWKQISIRNGKKAELSVCRNGNLECLPISRRVAEELIAAGFAYEF